MPSPQSASRPPRRALHQRSSSETNKDASRSSIRLVPATKDDVVTPYPTKPEHVLSPSSPAFPISDAQPSLGGAPTPPTVDPSNVPHFFDDTENRLFPDRSRNALFSARRNDNDNDDEEEEEQDVDDDQDGIGIAILPTDTPTIKTVVSGTPIPETPPLDTCSRESTPNVVPLGPPSSPAATSPNYVRLGNSSSSSGGRSNSVASISSMGTVIRHTGSSAWINSDHSSARSRSYSPSRSYAPSIGSIPPVPSIPSGNSSPVSRSRAESAGSIPPVPPIPSSHHQVRNRSVSGGTAASIVTNSEGRAAVGRGVVLHYPTIRGPSGSSQKAESDPPLAPAQQDHHRHHHHSRDVSRASSQAIPSSELGSASSRDDDERIPSLSRPNNRAGQGSSSSEVTTSQSPQRADEGPSTIPKRIKAYYQGDGGVIPPSSIGGISPPPPILTQPKTRPKQRPPPTAKPRTDEEGEEEEDEIDADPRDPRNHWVRDSSRQISNQANTILPRTPTRPAGGAWSPHLFADRGQKHGGLWTAPSIDSSAEPTLGARNIQIYCFCLGFVMPLGKSTSPASSSSVF